MVFQFKQQNLFNHEDLGKDNSGNGSYLGLNGRLCGLKANIPRTPCLTRIKTCP